MSTYEFEAPKEGEVTYIQPSRLYENLGEVTLVVMRESDFKKLREIVRLANPASQLGA